VTTVPSRASEIAAEEVHEVKAEARSSRELGDFFDALGPAAYAQEAPPESDDETKTPS
jgi:hypothetical protein